MNVNGLNSNDSSNALERIVLYSDQANSAASSQKNEAATEQVELDQADANQFNSIKETVRTMKDGSRAKMIAELREKFLSGQLNEDYSGVAVANSMIADGYGEFLFS